MDAEKQGKSFGVGGYRGRIIFLGDGTEVLTDSDDTEMFDNADEDNDLESQVSKSSSTDKDGFPTPKTKTTGEAASGTESKAKGDAAQAKSGKGPQSASSTGLDGVFVKDESKPSKEHGD